MALGLSTLTRNGMMDAITTQIGASGKVRIYSGVRPATGGAATVLLAEDALSATSAPAAASGVLTFNAITTANATATGTASWFRVLTSANVAVIDGDVAVSGSDMNLNTTAIVSGGPVAISSWTLTAPNA